MFERLYYLIFTLATTENDKDPEFMTDYYDLRIKVCEAYGLYVEAVVGPDPGPDPSTEASPSEPRRPCSVIGLFFPCIDPLTEVFIFGLIIIAAVAFFYFYILRDRSNE